MASTWAIITETLTRALPYLNRVRLSDTPTEETIMKQKLLTIAIVAGIAMAAAATANAQSPGLGSGKVQTAVSYINRDTGTATENSNINVPSNCRTPDRYDEAQPVSPAGSTANNVHNDACLLDNRGRKVDDGSTFESYGVGYISACPDPDNLGPKVSILDQGPSGVAATRCRQSGYQDKGVAGDDEFHARLNSFVAGTQTVVWCYDENQNGCADERIQDVIVIEWRQPAP